MQAMAKAKRDRTTPKQKAAIESMAEELAAIGKEREDIERALIIEGVKTGAIPTWWAEKLLKPPPTESKPKRIRRGKQMSRLLPVLRDLYPPDGMPPDHVKTVKIVQKVLDEYKARKMGEVSRDVIERAIGRRES
jgi:hypothetical protein